ncbi:MAG: ABC transporter ATP-binding protein [Candidatus Competibacteraceae bacterium]|nr:MAG: ABC transporter ATP-binding protein [Candidatus Competibacteraceae bacterium]
MAEPPVIQVEDLCKHYGSVRAVDGISFDIARGATCALLGGNGAGKTTTIAMLLGLLLPTGGRIHILGEEVPRHQHRVLPRMNFSSPYVDLPQRLTVAENLTVYARLYGVPRVRERLAVLGRDLDIDAFFQRPYGSLSAGQKTRVALAKALLNEPDILLLDEPTASLDPDTADRMRGILTNFQRHSGATLLLASHNMSEVERLCDQVIMLRTGRVVASGTPRELIHRYGRKDMEEVFLDIARGIQSGEVIE